MVWTRVTRCRLRFAAGCLALAAALGPAQAQLDVGLELNRKTYVLYEPVEATVSVTNVAARDLVLGGTSEASSWLTFEVTGTDGATVHPWDTDYNIRPMVIKAGESVRRTIVLNRHYQLARRGNFAVRASVYFAPLQRYVPSRTQRFDIHEARLIWERGVGVPPDQGGGFRRFQILVLGQSDRNELYFRLRDEESDRVLGTYSLGRMVTHRDPQMATDGENRLHILFMGAPNIYGHYTILPTGETVGRQIYRDGGGNPPKLVQVPAGGIEVMGGTLDVPGEGPDDGLPDGAIVHGLSDRPPGWADPASP